MRCTAEAPRDPGDRTAHDLGLLDRALALDYLDGKARDAFTDMRARIGEGKFRVLTTLQRTWVLDAIENAETPARKTANGTHTMSPPVASRDDPPSERVQEFTRRQQAKAAE